MEKQLKPLVDELKIDSMGNIFTVKRGKRSVRPRIMIAAHSDEIGLIVKSVEDSGFIKIRKSRRWSKTTCSKAEWLRWAVT